MVLNILRVWFLYITNPTKSSFPTVTVQQVKEKLANLVMFDKVRWILGVGSRALGV